MIVDLRSDTVTKPTPEMLRAMAEAAVGDDVLGDDPTVHELEAKICAITGLESAVFVPSGTMGNQIGIAAITRPGDSILVEEDAHILHYEVGGLAVLNGLTVRSYCSDFGQIERAELERKFLTASLHTPGTTLLCLENSHNRHGGAVLTPESHANLAGFAHERGIPVHLDGARLFNAAVALDRPLRDFIEHVDSVSICLSKGLGAPVGSVLAGTHDHIDRARIWRKRMGGGMRQAGILAAAGIYALDHNVQKLADDHRRARAFSTELNQISGWSSPPPTTNIVMLDLPGPATEFAHRFAEHGVRAMPFGAQRMRFVFHLQVDDVALEHACKAVRQIALG